MLTLSKVENDDLNIRLVLNHWEWVQLLEQLFLIHSKPYPCALIMHLLWAIEVLLERQFYTSK